MDEYLAYYMLRPNDLFLVPLCIFFLFFIGRIVWKKYDNTPIQKYIFPAIILRFVFAILYTLVISYYYGFGDSHNYYQGVLDMHKAVQEDPSFLYNIYTKLKLDVNDPIYSYFRYDSYGYTHYYMLEPRNYMVSKFGLPFSLLFNKSFLCISFCISFFSFLGSWCIFRMFYDMYPHIHRKIAYATLFLPSLLFWGVSLLKDPICMGAMGFFIYACYRVFIKKKNVFSSIVIILLAGFLLYQTKPYILFCLTGVFSLWLFLRVRDKISQPALRTISTGLFAGLALVAGFFATQGLSQLDAGSKFSTDKILATIQSQQTTFSKNAADDGGGSNFSLNLDEGESVSGLRMILLIPQGIVNTYFRPFPWDVRSPMMIFSALEAFAFLALVWLCFSRIGIVKTFSIIFSDPVIAFCFVFAIIFGGIIGVTTLNFGALVRYKLPSLSFFALAFILTMDKSGKFQREYIFSKKLF